MQQSKNATVLFSGGIDSTAAAKYFLERGFVVETLFVDYGQKSAEQELQAADKLSQYLEVDLKVISVEGAKTFGAGEIRGRNAFLILTALTFGAPLGGLIALGAHAGTPYYDCSRAFFDRIDTLVSEITSGVSAVSVPFLEWNKGDVFEYFQSANLPVDITYSCETGGTPPCGRCLSCLDRKRLQC